MYLIFLDHVSKLRWHRLLKSILIVEGKNPFILHSQYHGWWCPGNTRSQGISIYDIYLVLLEYSSFSPWRVKVLSHCDRSQKLALGVIYSMKLKKDYSIALVVLAHLGLLLHIQSSGIIRQSNITWYCTHRWGTEAEHHLPDGRVMGCLSWIILIKLTMF